MPNYNMNSLIVGGTGKHRFLTVKNHQLITPVVNRSFETGIGDWTYAGDPADNVLTRVADSDTQFGNYCLKIEDDEAAKANYGIYTHTLNSGTLDGRKFALYFWARSDSIDDGCIEMNSNSSSPDEQLCYLDIGLTTLWKPYIIICSANDGADGTELNLYFKPYAYSEGVAGEGVMYIDGVQLFEIDWDFQLKQSTKFQQKWQENVDADYRLIGGNEKIYLNGSIYKANLQWDYFEPPEELVKHKIYAAGMLLFMPHIDYNWAILCRRDGDNVRDYFHDRYIGHVGKINLKGLEILESDPPEIPSGAGAGDMFGSGSLTWEDVLVT